MLEKLDRMKLEYSLTPYKKINSKWIRDLNEGPDSVKLWAENIDRTLYDINHNKILFDTPPREMEIKTKINKWDIMKLLHSKGNHKQDEKTTLKMWENICKWINGQTINLQNNKQLMQLNIKETNNPIQKWAEDLNRHFSKEDIQMANKHMKSCSASLILEKCKSKLQWGITSHQLEWASPGNLQTTNAGEGVEKREHSFTVGGTVNWYSHYGEQYGGFLKN